MARQGLTRLGPAWCDTTWRGEAMARQARHGGARLGLASQDSTRRDAAWRGEAGVAGRGKAGLGWERPGMAGSGEAGEALAWQD
jgi:hypothetical protein